MELTKKQSETEQSIEHVVPAWAISAAMMVALPLGCAPDAVSAIAETIAKEWRDGSGGVDLLAACEALMDHVNAGELVRNTDGDGRSDWAIRQLPLVRSIRAAQVAILKAKGEQE